MLFHPIRSTVLVLALASVLLLGGGGADPVLAARDIDESRESLKAIEERITRATRSLNEKKALEKSIKNDLKTVESALLKIRKKAEQQGKRLESLEKEAEAARARAQKSAESVRELKPKIEKRLVALYKGGEMGFIAALFSSQSPARLAEDYDFLGRIVRQDKALLGEFRKKFSEHKEAQLLQERLRQQQQQLLAETQQNKQTMTRAVSLKQQLLAQASKDRSFLVNQLAELKEKAARLGSLVKKLESAQTPEYIEKSSLFLDQKGRLPWPVSGRVDVGFGTRKHAELGTMYQSHGLEIAVTGEHPVQAVWDGKVIFANWFKGYGHLLILDHGDGYYTLYAQASRLSRKVGDEVKRGATVAFSGSGGNPVVYFEIRRRGTPLDPAEWLSKR